MGYTDAVTIVTATATPVAAIRERLAGSAEEGWGSFTAADWPALFPLLGVAADLPRSPADLAHAELPPEISRRDALRLQKLVDRPVVPADASPGICHPLSDLERATAELEEARCVTVDFLLDDRQQSDLDSLVAELARTRMGSWGQLERGEAPALFVLFDGALGSERFRALTGFEPERDEYTLTLSLQDLDRTGIGWHRDLYWPREWVGEDVFAVLYGLGDDSPEKGGAFLYYVPRQNALYAAWRQRHQATVLWNCRQSEERLLHAVSGYRGADTSRHLIILQCLRRADGA